MGLESPPAPPIRAAQGQGTVGLDFSSSGNNQQIALFIITCNDTPGAFEVKFEFTNACQFKCDRHGGAIPMTDLIWNHISGNLGTGLTEPADNDAFHHRTAGGTVYEWIPQGIGQKTETVNYILELKATWSTPIRMLYGFYYETINATVIAQ